ncbi:putative feruloyl esterase b protein [Phaeoacremonium minimum UCRPA7]|uniref:Carboxylic ester hydrolase n=1 Tax=Phaeoacremonium minimum (strain UCR-PA7) TaxID=1286976 RepID=R8B9P3_PHAM7|nr:putative feruloyl esterase b protein [Phaeoacremonium minimum UCRPA7]EON96030.1 putative feruloyl esterase b protein [Phaeoacremonium minimum UCRPA7]
MTLSTSNRSGIDMEVWLPKNWTGRFLSTGNGGLGGCIQYEDIEYATSLGFAAVGTNNGHNGMTGQAFLNNPDVVQDFAYRALHTGVLIGKQVSNTFYGSEYTKSYYLGCSTGGRQGFKEAQTFPDDFDGIVAGAPAFSFNNLTSWSCDFLIRTGPPGSETFVPVDMWQTIHADILKQCDSLDGYVDGILESPDLCDYNPGDLVCAAGQTSNCLTEVQADTVGKIFSPLRMPDGNLVYPRMQPGSETTEATFTYYTGQEFGAADWFRYAIFNNPQWNASMLTPADFLLSERLNLFNIETWDGDLSAFQARGGKLLHYHGQADGIISSENSPRYYNHVLDTMGLTPTQVDDFYRFFRISGMGHCGGGPGASFIGNQKRNAATLDASGNVLMAIVRWVEDGIAPDTITGTAYINGSEVAGVAYQRNHCRWPYRNVHKGSGGPGAENWECVV